MFPEKARGGGHLQAEETHPDAERGAVENGFCQEQLKRERVASQISPPKIGTLNTRRLEEMMGIYAAAGCPVGI